MHAPKKRRTRFMTGGDAADGSSSQILTSAVAKPSLPTLVEPQKTALGLSLRTPPHQQPGGVLQIDGKSPSEHYVSFFSMILGRNKVVAAYRRNEIYDPVRSAGPSTAWLMEVSGADVRRHIELCRSICHENIVGLLAVYGIENDLVVAYEFLPMSLSDVIASRSLSAAESATILKQVIDGFLYLEYRGLCPSRLTCSDILINHKCAVKIWGVQYYRSQSSTTMVGSLCLLTAQIMSGCEDIQPEAVVYDRWKDQADFIDFFKKTMTASSISADSQIKGPLDRLSQHPFFAHAPPADSLELLLHLTTYTTYWPVQYSDVEQG